MMTEHHSRIVEFCLSRVQRSFQSLFLARCGVALTLPAGDMDWDRFRKDGHEMIDFIADYMQKGQLDQPGTPACLH